MEFSSLGDFRSCYYPHPDCRWTHSYHHQFRYDYRQCTRIHRQVIHGRLYPNIIDARPRHRNAEILIIHLVVKTCQCRDPLTSRIKAILAQCHFRHEKYRVLLASGSFAEGYPRAYRQLIFWNLQGCRSVEVVWCFDIIDPYRGLIIMAVTIAYPKDTPYPISIMPTGVSQSGAFLSSGFRRWH